MAKPLQLFIGSNARGRLVHVAQSLMGPWFARESFLSKGNNDFTAWLPIPEPERLTEFQAGDTTFKVPDYRAGDFIGYDGIVLTKAYLTSYEFRIELPE